MEATANMVLSRLLAVMLAAMLAFVAHLRVAVMLVQGRPF